MKKRQPNQAEFHAAKEYVDKQIAVMRKYGSMRELSALEYHELIMKIAKVALRLYGGRE